MSRISPPFTENMHSEAGFQSYHKDDTQTLESPSSPMMVPIPHLFQNQKTVDGNTKRMSDCGYPATAIKVDQPYQSFLNHPFTKLQQQQYSPPKDPNPQQQKPQAYINKYNSYTNSSKSIRLITIPSTSSVLSSIEKSKMSSQMTALDSPTSPMVSPPPPYLHSDHGDARFSPDSKNQYQSHHRQTSSQHGLQQQQQPQWPSMMMLSSSAGVTTTAATVTRPKLARVLPPQAIPIVTSGLGISNLARGPSSADATPLTATTPRPSRLMKMLMMDSSSVQMSEECLDTPAMQTSSAMSATVMGPMSLRSGSPLAYPGFWEEARLSKMHYVFLSFGLVMMSSAIWVLVMQVFLLEWAMVMPATFLVLFGLQYGRYRWKRNKHNQQTKKNGEASVSAAVVAAAAAAAAQAQLSSSYSPRESNAYLEPHQPRNFYATPVPQHHVTFRDEEQQQQQQQEQQQQQQQQPFNQQAYKQPRLSQQQQQQPSKKYPQHRQFRPSATPMSASPSSSSLVSMSSLSSSMSSSTSSSVSSMGHNKAVVNSGSPYYQNHQFLSPVDSPTTPPPAYFKKMELPEIGSMVGDLVSEFEVDFSSIKY